MDWQPIETAPQDGTRVYLMRVRSAALKTLPDILWVKVGRWYGHWQHGYIKCWREDSLAAGWDTGMIPLAPSHWAPLDKIDPSLLL
jgi:hypothetical protein